MRTWLAKRRVLNRADVFVGHAPEGATTGPIYVHDEPEHLIDSATAVEDLFQELAPRVHRPFATSSR